MSVIEDNIFVGIWPRLWPGGVSAGGSGDVVSDVVMCMAHWMTVRSGEKGSGKAKRNEAETPDFDVHL